MKKGSALPLIYAGVLVASALLGVALGELVSHGDLRRDLSSVIDLPKEAGAWFKLMGLFIACVGAFAVFLDKKELISKPKINPETVFDLYRHVRLFPLFIRALLFCFPFMLISGILGGLPVKVVAYFLLLAFPPVTMCIVFFCATVYAYYDYSARFTRTVPKLVLTGILATGMVLVLGVMVFGPTPFFSKTDPISCACEAFCFGAGGLAYFLYGSRIFFRIIKEELGRAEAGEGKEASHPAE
ncbi:hypothetical protein [Ammonifex thiophilus]|uniref:Uncharacterized protein n=1 Tax=Ammonifex thiophilus TaxID=444093 RepID=A0A3D8P8L9_9THEO|nr:hypothetical protein [Ammonifex thiophilus]RDV84851.1 hypothetical protein DXX99_02090 [Ammonifex thiophilus]